MTYTEISNTERRLIVLGSLLGTLLYTVDTTIANIVIPHMQGALSATLDQVGWVLTSYIVASSIATLPTANLANRFGVKPIYLIAITGFTGASVLCGLATNLREIVFFRILQGVFGSALVPLAQSVLLGSHPPEKVPSAMALWTAGSVLGPIIGPVLGGYLTEQYSWRWVFFVNIPVGICSFLALSVSLPKSETKTPKAIDYKGFLFLSVAIGSLQLMLDRGQSKGWFESTEIAVECVVAITAFYLFLVQTFTVKNPYLSPHLFKDRNLLTGILMMLFNGMVLYSTLVLLPPYLQTLKGYPVLAAGYLLAPRGLGMIASLRIAPYLMYRVNPRFILLGGMLCSTAGIYWMSLFSLDTSANEIIWSGVLNGFGMGLVMVPVTSISFSTLPEHFRNEGTAAFNLIRSVASSIGIALTFAYLDYGTKMARSVLVESINPYNPAIINYVNSDTLSNSAQVLLALQIELQREAAVIGMLGVLHYVLIGSFLLMPVPFLMNVRKK